MKYMGRKIITILLILCAVMSVAGCQDELTEAKNTVQVYLTALSNFNLDAMKTSLDQGTNEDMGIDTSVYQSTYIQTDTYKKAVDSMYKSLSNMMEFTIHEAEKQEDGSYLVYTTLKCADVNREAVDTFMQIRVDEYTQKHPEILQKTELDQNNIGIQVMAEAYREFVQLQPKVSADVKIAVCKTGGNWRIISDDRNQELKQWIQDMFGTF